MSIAHNSGVAWSTGDLAGPSLRGASKVLDGLETMQVPKARKGDAPGKRYALVPMETMHDLCQEQNWHKVMELVQTSNQSRLQDTYGYLGLHLALRHGAPARVIEALVQSYPPGASQADDDQYLPLHWAVSGKPLRGSWALSAVMGGRAKDAPVAQGFKREDDTVRKPRATMVLETGQPGVVKMLLAANPAAARVKADGALPLHLASRFGAPLSVINLLLNAHPGGAREKDKDGKLPLHIAVQYEADSEVITRLQNAIWTPVVQKAEADQLAAITQDDKTVPGELGRQYGLCN